RRATPRARRRIPAAADAATTDHAVARTGRDDGRTRAVAGARGAGAGLRGAARELLGLAQTRYARYFRARPEELSREHMRNASMSAIADALREKLRTRRARTGIVGLGYVGLPLAVELGKAGFRATGIDLDLRKVQSINDGRAYIPDIQPLDVQALRAAGRLDATTDFSVVRELDTINICVPTPLRNTTDPDMSYIVSAAQGIATHLRPA